MNCPDLTPTLPPPAPILIVDDSAAVRRTLRTMIMELGNVAVAEAASGEEAIRCTKEQNFAVILMNMIMPGLDGLGAAREVLTHTIPSPSLLMMVSNSEIDDDVADAAYKIGVIDILHKPIRPALLHAKLMPHLRYYREHQALAQANDRLVALSFEAQSASAAKSAFVANMSHEIRTPLNGILGTVELLKRTKMDANQQRYSEIINASGEALLGILNDILDLAKIEAGRTSILPSTFDLDPFIDEVTSPHLPRAAANRVELMVIYGADVPAAMTTDRVLLKQILFNFLSNAVKFTPHGHVALEITRPTPDHLRFAVRDTGIGIPPDRLNTVFDSFTQVDPSTTRAHGGTGLGLSITRQLATILGGTTSVESTQGQGSLFWLDLPMMMPDRAPRSFNKEILMIGPNDAVMSMMMQNLSSIGATNVNYLDKPSLHRVAAMTEGDGIVMIRLGLLAEVPGPTLDQWIAKLGHRLVFIRGSFDVQDSLRGGSEQILDALHNQTALLDVLLGKAETVITYEKNENITGSVLLVDDDPVNRLVAGETLEQLGYNVSIAENGLKAVEKAKLMRFDVILMDCMMPNMSGYQATEIIRSTDNPNKETRIIALTANVMETDRQKALASGMNDFIGKPFRQKDLAEKMKGRQ